MNISSACSPSHALQAKYLQVRWGKDCLRRVLHAWSCLAATNSIARASFVVRLQRVRLQQLMRSWHVAAQGCRRCRAEAWVQWQEYVRWRQAVPELLMTAYRAYYLRSACTLCQPRWAILLKGPAGVRLLCASYISMWGQYVKEARACHSQTGSALKLARDRPCIL